MLPYPQHSVPRAVLLLLLGGLCVMASDGGPVGKARSILFVELESGHGWPRIHAAEALCAVGEKNHVRSVFLNEEKSTTHWPDHTLIGHWRVLAAAANSPEERGHYISRIEEAFLDRGHPSRLHALESLCKLGVAPTGALQDAIREYSGEAKPLDALYAHWALSRAADDGLRLHSLHALAEALQSGDPLFRLRAAYAVCRLKPRDENIHSALRAAALNEPGDAPSCAYIWGAAFVLLPEGGMDSPWKRRLETILESGGPSNARYEASQCLLTVPSIARMNESRFLPLLDSSDADTRIGAAWALLSGLISSKAEQDANRTTDSQPNTNKKEPQNE